MTWFRNTLSGQVFEAEGAQEKIARKDRDCVELAGPPANDGETHPELAGLRERLTALEVPFSDKATAEELRALVETTATSLRSELEQQFAVKGTSSWKPETLKAKLDTLKAEAALKNDPPPAK